MILLYFGNMVTIVFIQMALIYVTTPLQPKTCARPSTIVLVTFSVCLSFHSTPFPQWLVISFM